MNLLEPALRRAVANFLQSDEGHRCLCAAIVKVQLGRQLEVAIETAKRQLVDELNSEIRYVHGLINSEIGAAIAQLHDDNRREAASLRQEYQAERERIANRAADVQQDLRKSVAEFEEEIVEQTKLSMTGVIHDTLALDLQRLLHQEVKAFVRSNPVSLDLTNRQIAAANQISIREVKRRKRCGLI